MNCHVIGSEFIVLWIMLVLSSLVAAKTSGRYIESSGGRGWHWPGQLCHAHQAQRFLPCADNRFVSLTPAAVAALTFLCTESVELTLLTKIL